MKWFIKLMLPALVLASCSKEEGSLSEIFPSSTGEGTEVISHGEMELGRKLENPYSRENMTKALSLLYPTRSSSEQVPVTDLYVRFLPSGIEDFETLQALGVELFDHPLDREILSDGDYYHDPQIPEGRITWQYAVVPPDFPFPQGIETEVLEECFIPSDDLVTKGLDSVDWDSVERLSFKETGNSSMMPAETRAKSKSKPSGKISIKDDKLGKTVGVAGVKVVANVFVKISTTYTDGQGNYSFQAKFSARPKYSLCFQNTKGFTIGLNLILVPASVSTLGKDDPEGIDVSIDSKSDATLFRRCVVNNAAYDYYQRCSATGVTTPPKKLRFWILNKAIPSSAIMMHQGAILDNKLVSNFLDAYKVIVQVFSPDITIGSKDKNGKYAELYATTTHEMAHASHFSQVRSPFWNIFASYILSSYLTTGSCYGTGNGENAGYCEVAEMWAYYVDNMVYKERYGSIPRRGYSNWFHPDILVSLEEGGVSRAEICQALRPSVTNVTAFRDELINVCPAKKTLITNAFKRSTR